MQLNIFDEHLTSKVVHPLFYNFDVIAIFYFCIRPKNIILTLKLKTIALLLFQMTCTIIETII